MFRVSATYFPQDDMFFDADHYENVHIPLAAHQMKKAGVVYEGIEVVFDEKLIEGDNATVSPCVFSVYFNSLNEVKKFQAFRNSPDVEPLRDDLPKYTNCSNRWTVSRVVRAGASNAA